VVASDKTHLTNFSGDKQAWPVYLTLGNIDKATRRKPSSRSHILLGYLPVSKLECYTEDRRSHEQHQLFHDCMKLLLDPLEEAGRNGLLMTCADGVRRKVYPLLSAYVADYPEQCLITCVRENSCPICTVTPKLRGNPAPSEPRNATATLDILTRQAEGEKPAEFKSQNFRLIRPFWRDLPYCNIHDCMTPDILHQLHKGVFGDHVAAWAKKASDCTTQEMDARFVAMTQHSTLRHFKKGISLTTQWTGAEYKAMEKVFLGILAGSADPAVIKTVRALLDFIHYAHFEVHTDHSLEAMEDAWRRIHENKEVFVELEIRKHFNISKFHNIRHYLDSIRSRGTADAFNTEISERLHIDFAKAGYRASNRKNYLAQMTKWLNRMEAVHRFGTYLQWAMPGYTAGSSQEELDDEDDDEDDEQGSLKDDEEEAEEEAELEAKPEEEPELEQVEVSDENSISYEIAKHAPYPHTSVQEIVEEYKCVDFLYYLEAFITKHLIEVKGIPNHSTVFPVYKQAVLTLPTFLRAASERRRDVVQATRAVSASRATNGGYKVAVPPYTSTVIVRAGNEGSKSTGVLNGELVSSC
jgi:hypothetical protein